MSAPELRTFFDTSRCDGEWQTYLLLLYSPLGLVLGIIRLFITLHMYLAASILPKMSSLRNFVLETMLFVLGVKITQDTSKARKSEEAKVLISNHISKFDFLPFHILSCNTPNLASFSFPFGGESWGLLNLGRLSRTNRSSFLSRLKNHLSKTDSSIVLFPEEETTNGKTGLLKFASWPVSACNCVQPVVLSARRPITRAALSTLPSSWLSDFFWFLFTPCTIYTIKFLPVVKRSPNESDEELIDRIEHAIASELNLAQSEYKAFDKYVLERRLKRESAAAAASSSSPQTRQYDSRVYSEAQRIREILPHLPLNMIIRELGRSHGNTEITIARLIDTYQSPSSAPSSFSQSPNSSFPVAIVTPSSSSTSSRRRSSATSANQFNRSPTNRMTAFAERKQAFIEEARARYIEKHNLNIEPVS